MYIVILKHVSVVSSGSYWNIIFDITHRRQHIQNWMQIFPVSLYNRKPVICEKACKKVSLRNFTSHYIPSNIGNVYSPTHASFQTCFEVKYAPDMGLDKQWQSVKLPMLYLDVFLELKNMDWVENLRQDSVYFVMGTFWWKFQILIKSVTIEIKRFI